MNGSNAMVKILSRKNISIKVSTKNQEIHKKYKIQTSTRGTPDVFLSQNP
jgi:hypothetical protein